MIVYGHRGARGEAPENTLPGFIHSYRAGIRHYELDVLLSRDGVPVVIHDPTLERTTGVPGRVADMTASELARLDARRNTAPWGKPVGIPTLEEVLEHCPEVLHWQFEVKTDTRTRLNVLCNRLTELIQSRQIFDRVAVTSSDTWFLQEIKRRNRRIHTGYVAARRFPRPVATAVRLDCTYLVPGWRLCNESMIRQAHGHGLHVSAWTMNRIHEMLYLESLGVDSIITDFPTSTRMFFDNRSDSPLSLEAPSAADSSPLPDPQA